MNALGLLKSHKARGVVLKPHGGKLLVYAPAGTLNEADRDRLARLKPDLLAILTCPTCARPLDDKGRCWKCCDRTCSTGCGRWTGSAFIALCCQCQAAV